MLRPETAALLCAYGADGSTDDGKKKCTRPEPAALRQGKKQPWYDANCVPGCGSPPRWCAVGGGGANEFQHCGFDGAQSSKIQPFRPEDLNVMLMQHAERGAAFKGMGTSGGFKGYNEVGHRRCSARL